MAAYEIRLRGNNPKFIDIMTKGAADSSGAVARIPLRDGFFDTQMEAATLLAGAPDLRDALRDLLEAVQRSTCAGSGPAQDKAIQALADATYTKFK
jgi:hypothetical protein